MLEELLTLTIFHFFLIFVRIGAAMILMPGFGEIYVSTQIRLLFALSISLVMMPSLENTLPPIPGNVVSLFLVVLSEAAVGVFIGGIARMLQGALHMAGMIIAFQSSLASALLFDANQSSQGSVFGNFMTLVGLTMIFTSDLHHLILAGIFESYGLFIPGQFPPIDDFASFASKTLSAGFLVAFKISAPMMVIGLLLYLGAGMMARLMPNMQVFFVMVPVQIYISFALLTMTLAGGMMWYLKYLEGHFHILFGI